MRPERILFVRTDRLGDVLMNLPAIRLLRQTYPKAWITLLLDQPLANYLKKHPDLDEVIAVDAKRLKRDLSYRFRAIRSLRAARFDMAIVSNPDAFWHAGVFFAGSRIRIGYRRKNSFFLNRTIPDEKGKSGRHEIDHNLDLAKLAGAERPWDGKVELPIDPAASRSIEGRIKNAGLSETPILIVHPGTSDPRKRWPLEPFGEVCEAIGRAGLGKILLVGGAEEKEISEALQKRLPAVIDWTGELSLLETTALFQRPQVKTLLSSDSGPVHIAWMSGLPVVALYAENVPGCDPRRWGPPVGENRLIYKPMTAITAGEVIEAVENLVLKRQSVWEKN